MRKVRKDKGTRKPHQSWCAHCKMVQEYRDARDAQIERLGGWRNEDAPRDPSVPRFKQWLQTYYREQRAQTMPKLPRPLPLYDINSDRYPDDDYYIQRGKCTMLNRIDQEWDCGQILFTQMDKGKIVGYEFCGLSEHDPFTNRCRDHTPGNLSSGHM